MVRFHRFVALTMLTLRTNASHGATTAQGDQGMQPQLPGLVERERQPETQYAAIVNAFVIDLRWADVHPYHEGRDLVVDNVLQRALNCIPQGMRIKLRIRGGIHAPDWAKQTRAAPIRLHDPPKQQTATVRRSWSWRYTRA